MSEYEMNRIA